MPALYMCPAGEQAGVTTIALGLALALKRAGQTPGYFKPYSAGPQDTDANLARQALGLIDNELDLCPCRPGDPISGVLPAAARVGAGKSLLIAEGRVGGGTPDPALVAKELKAQVVLVARYAGQETAGTILDGRKPFESGFLGVIINNVPTTQETFVREKVIPSLPSRQLTILGIIPQARELLAVTPLELASEIEGEMVAANGGEGSLIANVLIGAVSYEGATSYMGRKIQKAVITGANRPDIALAALATSTSCLILTGDYPIDPTVLAVARYKNIAVVRTKLDTQSTLGRAQQAFGANPLKPGAQLIIAEDLVRRSVDIPKISEALGLG